MELSTSLFGAIVDNGDIFFVKEDCPFPIGQSGHPHICITHKGKVIMLCTCSSQINTSIRLAKRNGEDIATFPIVQMSEINQLSSDSYVDCNKPIVISEEEFGDFFSNGYIRKWTDSSKVSVEDLEALVKGIKLSRNVSKEIKKLLD